MTDSLLDRDPTPEDRAAERDEPRPGVWAGQDHMTRGDPCDLRKLTQDETDCLTVGDVGFIDARGDVFVAGGHARITGIATDLLTVAQRRPRQPGPVQDRPPIPPWARKRRRR